MEIEKYEYKMKRGGIKCDGTMYVFFNVSGISLPFQLYIPHDISEMPDLIVANRTPRTMTDVSFEESINVCRNDGPNPIGRLLSYDLKNPCLMPIIPRTIGIDASYLGYNIYHNIFDEAYEAIEKNKIKFTKEDIKKFENLDDQIYKMIEYSILFLKSKNINVDDKVIMTGYSAAAKLSIFFSALHPNLVKTIIAGGTGGNNIIPDASLGLTYPLGVSDIKGFDFEKFSQINQFYYIGNDDYNDLTKYKTRYETFIEDGKEKYIKDADGNTIPKRNDGLKGYHSEVRNGKSVYISDMIPFDKLDFELDENGNYQMAYPGYYTLEQIEYIVKNIGTNPQIRFDNIKNIYEDLGVKAVFKKYSGDHITVFSNKELFMDVIDFCSHLSINKKY